MVETHVPSDVPWHKEHEYIRSRGNDLNSFRDISVYGDGDDPRGHILCIAYTCTACNRRNQNINSLGVGISIVFKIFSNFPFLGCVCGGGGGLTPGVISNVLHILPVVSEYLISVSLTVNNTVVWGNVKIWFFHSNALSDVELFNMIWIDLSPQALM
jgi:hypothetical protein